MRLRLLFMGTAEFAVPSLHALIVAGHDIAGVYTQPSRPRGRGHRPLPSPVARLADEHGLAIRTPERLDPTEIAAIRGQDLDAVVVAAYGLILPRALLEASRLGAINVHASLLPRWRGAAPIERAVLAGDAETGITIMRMDEGLDTGPILLQSRLAIGARMTAAELHDLLAARGARLLLDALMGLATGEIAPRPQPAGGATYAKKLRREEGAIDWRNSAAEIDRLVRALNPRLPTWFRHADQRIKLLDALPAAGEGEPGTVLDAVPTIACGAGALRLLRVQREGRAALDATEFLRGYPLPPGTILPCPATS
jgi:methionyl-tRNA formyltransferase